MEKGMLIVIGLAIGIVSAIVTSILSKRIRKGLFVIGLVICVAVGIAWIYFMVNTLLSKSVNASGINDVQYSADGTRLAIARSVGVWLYDLNSDKAPELLTTDATGADNVSFSPDGQILAAGCEDELIRFWDVSTGEHKKTLIAEHGGDLRVRFSRDGNTLVSWGSREVNLWDVATSAHKQASTKYEDYANVSINGNDVSLVSIDNKNEYIRLLDFTTGEENKKLRGHTESVESIAFSPDGKTLASGSADKTVRLWDVATGKHKQTLKGHRKSISGIAFSADGQLLATAGDHTVRVWDVLTGTHKKTFEGHTSDVKGVAFSPDGRTIVSWSNDRTIRLWDVDTGEFKKELQYPRLTQF